MIRPTPTLPTDDTGNYLQDSQVASGANTDNLTEVMPQNKMIKLFSFVFIAGCLMVHS